MIIVHGEVYLEQWHIVMLRKEPEIVRQRYQAIARTLVNNIIRISRQEAAAMINTSKRQLQRIVKRFRTEGIVGLRFKSKKLHNITNRTSYIIENRIVAIDNSNVNKSIIPWENLIQLGEPPISIAVNSNQKENKIYVVNSIHIRTFLLRRIQQRLLTLNDYFPV
jgi:hypothetical protein